MQTPGSKESWEVLVGLFPQGWREQARQLGAVERLRGFASLDDLMRTLLLHVGQGYSLRETAVRAKAAGLGAVSDVALLKRLRKSEVWLQSLCLQLLEEDGIQAPPASPRDRKSTRLNSSHIQKSRMPSSA